MRACPRCLDADRETAGAAFQFAAGPAVTSNVPADALTIARARQVDKPGRGAELRARLQTGKR